MGHSTAIAFASILSVAAIGSTLAAPYEEKGKPSPQPSPGMTQPSPAATAVPATRPKEPATPAGVGYEPRHDETNDNHE